MKIRIKPKSIHECQDYLYGLYGPANSNRSSDYLYGYLSRSAAYLGKNLSLKKAEDQHFLRALSWLFSIASYYDLDLQQCLFSRFPKICPYCLTAPCICFRTNKQPISYIPAYKTQEELNAKYKVLENSMHDWSLTSAVTILAKIYPNNEVIWHHAGPWHLLAKMQEEIGELHEAISKFASAEKPKSAIGEELADTFAWLLSAWGIVFPNRSFDDALIDYYQHDCPVCRRYPCSCNDRADRAAELVDPRVLDTIRTHLDELEAVLPGAAESLQDLKKSVSAAYASQSEPTTLHALKETKGTLERIKDGVDIGDKSFSIITKIIKLIEMTPWF